MGNANLGSKICFVGAQFDMLFLYKWTHVRLWGENQKIYCTEKTQRMCDQQLALNVFQQRTDRCTCFVIKFDGEEKTISSKL